MSQRIKTPLDQFGEVFHSNTLKYAYYKISGHDPDSYMEHLMMNVVKPGMRVLEVEIGSGVLSMLCAVLGADVVGITQFPVQSIFAENLKHIEFEKYRLIESATKLNYNAKSILKAKFQISTIDNLPFEKQSFDLIFSYQFAGDIEKLLTCSREYLKGKGLLVLCLDLKKQHKIGNKSVSKETIQEHIQAHSLTVKLVEEMDNDLIVMASQSNR